MTCCPLSFIHGEQRSETGMDSAAGENGGKVLEVVVEVVAGLLAEPPLTAANSRKVGP